MCGTNRKVQPLKPRAKTVRGKDGRDSQAKWSAHSDMGGGIGDRRVQDTHLEAPQTDGAQQPLSNRPPADTAAPQTTRSVSRSSRVSGNDPNPGRGNAEKTTPPTSAVFKVNFAVLSPEVCLA